jgi:hypothetical protein
MGNDFSSKSGRLQSPLMASMSWPGLQRIVHLWPPPVREACGLRADAPTFRPGSPESAPLLRYCEPGARGILPDRAPPRRDGLTQSSGCSHVAAIRALVTGDIPLQEPQDTRVLSSAMAPWRDVQDRHTLVELVKRHRILLLRHGCGSSRLLSWRGNASPMLSHTAPAPPA